MRNVNALQYALHELELVIFSLIAGHFCCCRGVAFGELALLHNAPRAATVTAEEKVSMHHGAST